MNQFKKNLNYSFQKIKKKLCTIFFKEQENDVNFYVMEISLLFHFGKNFFSFKAFDKLFVFQALRNTQFKNSISHLFEKKNNFVSTEGLLYLSMQNSVHLICNTV